MDFDINANCSLRITIRNVMYKILQLPHHRCRNNVGSGYRITHGSIIFLFQNLLHCIASHDTVQINQSVCHSVGGVLIVVA